MNAVWPAPAAGTEPLEQRLARLEAVVVSQAEELLRQREGQQALLRQSEQRYEQLVSISPYGVMLHHQSRIVFINQRGLEILGATRTEQVVGHQPTDFLLHDSIGLFWARNEQLLREGRIPCGEYRIQRVDGQVINIEAASVSFELEGSPAVQTVFQDVTARLALEQRQREFERATQVSQKLESLGLFAGGVAQRLNSLLIGILGNASLAQAEAIHHSSLSSIISEIEHASLQARALTSQMLALAGRSVNLAAQVDLNGVVTSELQRLGPRMPPQIRLVSNLEPALPAVEADTLQLQHALLQLIDNSAEALGQHEGTITVCTGLTMLDSASEIPGLHGQELPPGRYCYIEVSDAAGGIHPAQLPRLFDPFSVGREAGRGLGLPTALGILRAHRGSLQLQSTPEVGTRVRLLLPCPESLPGSKRLPATSEPAVLASRGTILVIDDEPVVLAVACGILRRGGFTVHSAQGGLAGLACYTQHAEQLDAVLLDLTMPEMDGAEVYRALLDQGCSLPVVFSSGYAAAEVQLRLGAVSPAALLQKPYSGDELLAVLERILPSRSRLEVL
jgi:PAS domain S-box-containing protein